jgi:hypothetical protein
MSDDGKVIPLPVRFRHERKRVLTVVPPRFDGCRHHSFQIDDETGRVTCGGCGEALEPLFVLRQLARQETEYHNYHATFKAECKRLAERSKTKCEHCKKITRISKP